MSSTKGSSARSSCQSSIAPGSVTPTHTPTPSCALHRRAVRAQKTGTITNPNQRQESTDDPRFHHAGRTCLRLFAMQRALIVLGLAIAAAGLAWPWLRRLPFGRLPGDIHVVREGFSFHFPIVTCIVVSIVVSLIFWMFRR